MRGRKEILAVVMLLALSLPVMGCLGWGDMFAPKHYISSEYFLMQGESESSAGVYLMMKGRSISLAGPLHQVGWNQQYIIFTDENLPDPWNVIRVTDHTQFKITEIQRAADPAFKVISILSPSKAWELKTR